MFDTFAFEPVEREAYHAVAFLAELCAEDNEKWWRSLETNEPIERNVGEMLMLVVSELAEALEGHRKNLPDDKLAHRDMFTVELADTLIRVFDIAGHMGLDLAGAFVEKRAYNLKREDHTAEARRLQHGKKY